MTRHFPLNWIMLLLVCGGGLKRGHRPDMKLDEAMQVQKGDSSTCQRCGFSITWDGEQWQTDEIFG